MSDLMHETTTRDDGRNRSARASVRRARRCVRRGVEKRTLGRAWCGSSGSSSSNLQRGDSSQIVSREPPQQQMEIDLKACKQLVYTPANDHSNTTPYLLCRCPAATTKFCGRCRPPPGGWLGVVDDENIKSNMPAKSTFLSVRVGFLTLQYSSGTAYSVHSFPSPPSYSAAIRICTYSRHVTLSYIFGLPSSSQQPGSASISVSGSGAAKKGIE